MAKGLTFLVVALASCLVLASAFDVSSVPTEVRHQFGQFIARYNRRYESIEEYKTRLAIFQQNLATIEALNSRSKGATYGITKFADVSSEEFRSKYLMSNPIQPTPVEERRGKVVSNPEKVDLPASLDWRDKGAVTAVKNQEQCGSCWAFSVTENVESMWILAGKATNTTLNLAPQQIVDCDQSDGGCNGGNPPTAYDYLINAGGLEGSKDYPYTGEDGSCNFNASDIQAKISNWKYATEYYSESELQTSLVSWGPLSICVDASNWQHYTSGVMTWEECAWVNLLDHCVQLVGYQTQSSDGAYWIVRNSWTTGWGIDGYIWLEMGHDTCGLAHEATTSVV